MENKFFTLSSFKNCSIEGSLGNTKWFFNGIDVKQTCILKSVCRLKRLLVCLQCMLDVLRAAVNNANQQGV